MPTSARKGRAPPDQPYRIKRLQDLLDGADFRGNKAALGKFLSYDSGAYVRQMLAGERPILEKTIHAIETAQNGRYAGWFSQPQARTELAMQIAERFDREVPESLRQATYAQIMNQIRFAADAARSARSDAVPAPTEQLQPN
jgi:hypothetical protein